MTAGIAAIGWFADTASLLFDLPGTSDVWEPGLGRLMLLASLAGAGDGLLFGGAQWFILRRHAEHARRWIWIHVPAWALAMTAIFIAATLPTADWSPSAIALTVVAGGAVGGLLLGAVTGLVARDLQPWVDERQWSLEGKVCAVTARTQASALRSRSVSRASAPRWCCSVAGALKENERAGRFSRSSREPTYR